MIGKGAVTSEAIDEGLDCAALTRTRLTLQTLSAHPPKTSAAHLLARRNPFNRMNRAIGRDAGGAARSGNNGPAPHRYRRSMTGGAWWSFAGGVIQFGGILFAAWGVRKTRQKHEPNPRENTANLPPWLRRWRRPPPAEGAVGATLPVMEADFGAGNEQEHVRRTLDPGATAEQRLTFLVTSLVQMESELDRLRGYAQAEVRDRRDADDALSGNLERSNGEVHLLVRSTALDGLSREMWGLWIAAAGTLLQVVGAAL